MTNFERGDVVLVDLVIAAKTRPCVVISVRQPDRERAMCVVVPMTTEARGGACEVKFPKPAWLKQPSVVNVLGIAGVDHSRILRRISPFPPAEFQRVLAATADMLGL